MTRVYLDVDGVIADFDKGIERAGFKNRNDFIHLPYDQWTEADKKVDLEVRSVMKQPGFWMSLPLMKGAYKLWDTVAEYNHYVLTAYPFKYEEPDITRVKDEKWIWLTDKFGGYDVNRFICCDRAEKKNHAKVGRVLIDDSKANCKEWEANGGTAILFQSAQQAIKELKRLG